MNCQEIQKLLHAYADGELDAVRSLDVEQHIDVCPACQRARENISVLKHAIVASAPYYKAPADLRASIIAAAEETTSTTTERPRTNQESVRGWRWNSLSAGLAMAACLAIGFFVAGQLHEGTSSNEMLVGELASAHVRSLLATHLMDVVSTDQHTVKPWFDGKLDFAPPVSDPETRGYSLIGGRLDYIGGRTVAAVVYKKEKHFINLFIWPDSADGNARRMAERNGYHLVNWHHGGMTFWAVSDISVDDLHEFAELTGTIPKTSEREK